jgi:hypothetical protein
MIITMHRAFGMETSLGVAAAVAIASGNLAAPADATEHQRIANSAGQAALTNASPDLSASVRKANEQLDFELAAEGPDSCLAKELASGLGITKAADRAKFITPDNIELAGKISAKSSTFAGKLGCKGEVLAKTANTRKSTVSYGIYADEVPKSSKRSVVKSNPGYTTKNAVLGTAGGNVLFKSKAKLPKRAAANFINSDVSYGIKLAANQAASAEVASLDDCEDKAGATAATQNIIKGINYAVKGEKVSFAEYRTAFDNNVESTKVTVKIAADKFNTKNGCVVQPPVEPKPPVTPEPPKPRPPMPPDGSPYWADSKGVDISWPQCAAKPTEVDAAEFGIVGVTAGIGFSTNPCLKTQADYFAGKNLTLYMNTAWNSESSHLDPNSPNSCTVTDKVCLAYNYGYAAANYAYDAATTAGVQSIFWWLDVENDATWSTNPIENRSSLQGMYDVFSSKGITTGVYSTTAQWNEITGGWQNKLPVWGATTWDTAEQAKTYCTPEHAFTGGPTYLMQYGGEIATRTIDLNVAC